MTDIDRSTVTIDDCDSLEWLGLSGPAEAESAETIRWRDGPRIQTAYPWVGLAVSATVAILAAVALELVSILAVLWLPFVCLPAVWALASVSRAAYVITDRRLAIRRGVLGVRVQTVGVERVQNTAVTQHAIARAVGYGTVTIEAASGATFAFRNVADPDSVRDRIEAQRDRPRTHELPGSIDEWEAVLTEVRAWRRALEKAT
ncbi:PH domain-containing protein [Natrialbaceae archaeon A-arb3/5]